METTRMDWRAHTLIIREIYNIKITNLKFFHLSALHVVVVVARAAMLGGRHINI